MERKALQKLAKKCEIKANQSNSELRRQLDLFVQNQTNPNDKKNNEPNAESSEDPIQFKKRKSKKFNEILEKIIIRKN